jgi:hypothetical protein
VGVERVAAKDENKDEDKEKENQRKKMNHHVRIVSPSSGNYWLAAREELCLSEVFLLSLIPTCSAGPTLTAPTGRFAAPLPRTNATEAARLVNGRRNLKAAAENLAGMSASSLVPRRSSSRKIALFFKNQILKIIIFQF